MKRLGRPLGLLSCALALSAAACMPETPPIFEDPLADLSFQEQARAAEKEFLDIADANVKKSCVRPVLRGEPLPGKAADDIIAVVEKAGEKDPCNAVLRLVNEMYGGCSDNSGASEDGYPQRRLCSIRLSFGEEGYAMTDEPAGAAGQGFPHSSPLAVTQSLNITEFEKQDERVARKCATVLGSLARTVAHEDACSPYLPGVRHVERHSDKFRYLASWIAAAALERARAGETQEAVESLLDLVRFGQDLHRGGAPLKEVYMGLTVSWHAVAALERILDNPESLGAPLLAQMDAELAALVASEPRPSEFLVGETANDALYTFLPWIHGSAWTPPGDMVGKPSKMRDAATGRRSLVQERQLRVAFERACGSDDTELVCFERMVSLGDAAMELGKLYGMNPFKWIELFGSPLVQFSVSKELYSKCIREHGQTRFYLGALRLLARYRALAEETGTCPGIDAFDRPDFAEARKDPYSGKPLEVEEVGPGRFLVSSPEELELGPYPNDAITLRVKCPFEGAAKPPADSGV